MRFWIKRNKMNILFRRVIFPPSSQLNQDWRLRLKEWTEVYHTKTKGKSIYMANARRCTPIHKMIECDRGTTSDCERERDIQMNYRWNEPLVSKVCPSCDQAHRVDLKWVAIDVHTSVCSNRHHRRYNYLDSKYTLAPFRRIEAYTSWICTNAKVRSWR